MYVGRLIKVGKWYHLRYHKDGDSANGRQQSLKAKTSTEALAKMNKFLADVNSEHPVLSDDTRWRTGANRTLNGSGHEEKGLEEIRATLADPPESYV